MAKEMRIENKAPSARRHLHKKGKRRACCFCCILCCLCKKNLRFFLSIADLVFRFCKLKICAFQFANFASPQELLDDSLYRYSEIGIRNVTLFLALVVAVSHWLALYSSSVAPLLPLPP